MSTVCEFLQFILSSRGCVGEKRFSRTEIQSCLGEGTGGSSFVEAGCSRDSAFMVMQSYFPPVG